jgi:hypothetical protein
VHFRSVVVFLACAMAAGTSSICAQLNTTSPLHHIPLALPCRAVDTRVTGGPIAGGTSQNFSPSAGGCSIPLPNDGIIAYAMNVTVVPHEGLGYLTVWPSGEEQPSVSTLNSYDGRVKANAAMCRAETAERSAQHKTALVNIKPKVSVDKNRQPPIPS